jgi:hypothetical protein
MRSRRMAVLGLAALCALVVGAVAAPGAQAEGKTGYTCIEGAGEENTNFHCVPGSEGEGNFGHVAIPPGEVTEGTIHPLGEQVFGAELFGAVIELTATGPECIECTGENVEVEELMGIAGTGRLGFTNVVVVKAAANCRVSSDPGGEEGVIETEPLQATNNVPTSGTVKPVTGTVIARFSIITTPGEHSKKCNLIGTYTVTGQVTGAANGATAIVDVTPASGELKLNGFPAFLEAEATVEAGSPGGPYHPVAATAS